MPEAEAFNPPKPQKKIIVEITAREAHLLKMLRGIEYGKVLIHKAEGLIIRCEPTNSHLINEEDGLDLAIEK